MKPILEISNVGKKYTIKHLAGGYLSLRERLTSAFTDQRETAEEFWALKDISFHVQPGESLAIIGRNGAGKSTLLKILSRITPPTTGKIVMRGRIASLLEVGTGFHSELTGRENIFLNGSLLGMKKAEIQSKFDEIVDFSGTERFLDTALKHFSSGMQLRLAFSVAAFLDPEIMVIDEVLAVGDVDFQKKCLGKMEEVTNQGRTILFVSHNLSALEYLCSKAVMLHNGNLMAQGEIKEIIARYLDIYSNDQHDAANRTSLTNDVFLESVNFNKTEIAPFESIQYSFVLRSPSPNRITDLCLLFFNHSGERVAIADLRHEHLWEKSSEKKTITIQGEIEFPFVEGNYSIGLYIVSSLCSGDFLNLKRINVRAIESEFIPYAVKYRGITELKHKSVIE